MKQHRVLTLVKIIVTVVIFSYGTIEPSKASPGNDMENKRIKERVRDEKQGDETPSAVKVVDVQKLDYSKPLEAVKEFQLGKPQKVVKCDVLIAGGGMGGVAAAIALLEELDEEDGNAAQIRVCLTEETDWLGGQMTSQGVSALDENWLVESSGATRKYQEMRRLIRQHYTARTKLDAVDIDEDRFNPGDCWVTRLAFEPKVGVTVIDDLLEPFIEDKSLSVFYRLKCVHVQRRVDKKGKTHIKSVVAVDLDKGETIEFRPSVVIDATELGDLLPLAGLSYSSGSESRSETGEPHAEETADTENVQDFVFPFVVEYKKRNQLHCIDEPHLFKEFLDQNRFSLLGYKMHSCMRLSLEDGSYRELLPFWTYRRLIDRNFFEGSAFDNDIAMINWESNDLRDENIIDVAPEVMAERLARGKALSLGFLYWLQTHVDRDDEGNGYPELFLRRDMLDSADGLSKYPYIRESRRIKAMRTVKETEIASRTNSGARAMLYDDSVGIGHYPIDIHGRKLEGTAQETRPFQVPLSCLIPVDAENLLPACKNIGVTHITNGAYRLHPIEWAIGTASGALARYCLSNRKSFEQVIKDRELVFAVQRRLIKSGAPIYWFDDVATTDEHFEAIQTVAARGLIQGQPDDLSFRPDSPVKRAEVASLLHSVYPEKKFSKIQLRDGGKEEGADAIQFTLSRDLLHSDDNGDFNPEAPLTADQLAKLARNKLVRIPEGLAPYIEPHPNKTVSRAQFTTWLTAVIDYQKRWSKIKPQAPAHSVRTGEEVAAVPH